MPFDHDTDVSTQLAELATRVLAGEALGPEEARVLTGIEGELRYELMFWANRIRLRHVGRAVKFCSIVAAKVGNCSEDCGFCSQSGHFQTPAEPEKLSVEAMRSATEQAEQNGASSIGIVNSGRGPSERELDWLEPFYEKTRREGKIRPCATLGELSPEKARRLKAMGVERINHNLETSRRHFPNICSTHTWQDRVNTIEAAKAAGLSICSGGIFGMGENWEDRIDMLLTLRELGADVVPLNFLNAIPGTPLHGKVDPIPPMEALKIVSIARFLLPEREIKVAGGREKILRDMQSWIFFAGANSFLIGNYLTTYGRSAEDDHQMLRDLEVAYAGYDEVEYEAPLETAPGPAPSAGSVPLPVLG